MTLSVAVLGGSGYTGADMLRLLLGHSQVRVVAIGGQRRAGLSMGEIFPHLGPYGLPEVEAVEAMDFDRLVAEVGLDVVFCCLPHGCTHALVRRIPGSVRVVDLSADFRLRDRDAYQAWYGDHEAFDLQGEAVYGLTEVYRDAIRGARLVACPGCFPTAALLGLAPVVRGGLVEAGNLVVNALTGVSGAGRALRESLLFCEVAESFQPYGLGAHRHMAEMEQEVSSWAGCAVRIGFTPHLVPVNRGELLTMTVERKAGVRSEDLVAALQAAYAEAPFVHVLEGGVPSSGDVRGSNMCRLAVFDDRVQGRSLIVSALDNLVKGSGGQALQNMNVMFGLAESAGLEHIALRP